MYILHSVRPNLAHVKKWAIFHSQYTFGGDKTRKIQFSILETMFKHDANAQKRAGIDLTSAALERI